MLEDFGSQTGLATESWRGGLMAVGPLGMLAAATLAGVLLGALLATMYFRPGLLAMAAKLKSVLFIAGGVGLMVWGIVSLSLGEPFQPPFAELSLWRSPAECVAWGAGLLTAGVLYLVYGFVGFGTRD